MLSDPDDLQVFHPSIHALLFIPCVLKKEEKRIGYNKIGRERCHHDH
jgi:hypothetical protein